MGKSIVIFGSGYITKSLLHYFSKYPEFKLTVISNDEHALNLLSQSFQNQSKFVRLDVSETAEIIKILLTGDLAISLLPPPLHPKIAELCLECNKHLVTSSYLNPTMERLAEKAKQKGLTFLFEVGLDPGIDHIATLKIIEDIRKRNGKIKRLYSFCGGLVSPNSVDNPLCYKFSWSPIGVFRALMNEAVFLQNGKVVNIKSQDLLYSAKQYKVNNALNVVYFPNRDSLKYRELYGIQEASTVLRGTFRYKGYCEIIAGFQELGLFSEKQTTFSDWVSFINNSISKFNQSSQFLNSSEIEKLKANFPAIDFSQVKIGQLLNCLTNNSYWKKLDKNSALERLNLIFEGIDFFGFLNKKFKMDPSKTVLENFIQTLTPFLEIKSNQTDSVIMTIKFDVEFPNNAQEEITFQFIRDGDKNGLSAMATLVGIPSAIAARLILEEKIVTRGLIGPFGNEIFHPMFEEMVKEGLIPNYTRREFKPKL